jgi:hypothetical protein
MTKMNAVVTADVIGSTKLSFEAINQRKKTAGWSGIESLLERFEELIKNASIESSISNEPM